MSGVVESRRTFLVLVGRDIGDIVIVELSGIGIIKIHVVVVSIRGIVVGVNGVVRGKEWGLVGDGGGGGMGRTGMLAIAIDCTTWCGNGNNLVDRGQNLTVV